MATVSTATLATELRSTSDEELVTRLTEAKEELFNLRFQVATGQLENNARLRSVRRSIARIYTVMRERELGIDYVVVGDESSSSSSVAVEAPEAAPATTKPKAEKAEAPAEVVAETPADTVAEAEAPSAETTPESGE